MAPFKSKAQAKYLFAQNPSVAKEFAAKTPSIKALPDYLPAAVGAVKSLVKPRKPQL